MAFYSMTPEQALRELDTTTLGLSDIEVGERRAHYGTNTIRVHGEPLWRKIIEPFRDILMLVLFLAVAISLWHQAYIDAAIIGAIIAISAVIYYIQRFSTERILRSLQKHQAIELLVRRKGGDKTIDSSQLVPGDIILLREGDKIPADARVLEARSLRVDESQLTGESLPVSKQAAALRGNLPVYEQSNMLFQGSFVVSGDVVALVTTTGNATEFGQLSELAANTQNVSPVQRKIRRLIARITAVIGAVAAVAFGLALLRGIEVGEALRFVIALSVSAVPEGLPVAISVILVLGMRRMAAKRALVRTMQSIESIGTVTTIATDKTGTLTKNRLTVQELWHNDNSQRAVTSALAHTILPPKQTGKFSDPLDAAFYQHVTSAKAAVKAAPMTVFEFEHTVALSGALYHHGKEYSLYLKGAPEAIIQRSDLTENEREAITTKLHHMTSLGFRVIALAHTTLTAPLQRIDKLPKRHKLDFGGLVAVADVLRPEARAAIATAQRAGITVRMITGDHYETAYHIGKQLGLVRHCSEVFDSRRIATMSDDELAAQLTTVRVFARVVPEHKHRILEALKRNHITAMTGDGINDVPALSSAHIGIAMGSGAAIAKDAGDIILLDDNFRSIVTAIQEGRTIYANIKRMIAYLLATNLGETIVSLASLAIGLPLPLTPVQLLWINLVTDTCMVIPLGLEPGQRNVMNKPPAPASAPLLSKFMISRIIVVALTMASLTLGLYIIFGNKYGHDYGRTVAFCALVTMQWASALCARSDYEPLWRRITRPNTPFVVGLVAAIALQFVAVFGPLGQALHVTTISIGDLAYISGIAFIVPIIIIELHKYLGRKLLHKGSARA